MTQPSPDSDLFFGTKGPTNAKIALVGEAWGSEEELQKKPFVGISGHVLDGMLKAAGLDPSSIFFTNLVAARPPSTQGLDSNDFRSFLHPSADAKVAKLAPFNGLFPSPLVSGGLDKVAKQLEIVRPELIIAAGNYPFWAFSSAGKVKPSTLPSGWRVPAGIGDWRGSQLVADRIAAGTRLLPIYHPSAVNRQWSLRALTIHDLKTRVPLALSGQWTKPSLRFLAPPSFGEARTFLWRTLEALDRGLVEIAVDLETRARRIITCIGFARTTLEAVCIPLIRPTIAGGVEPWWSLDEERLLVGLIRRVLNHPNARLIGQNFAYDIQYLSRWWGIRPRVYWDTMIAQHVAFPGTPKSLDYLASLHCTDFYRYWKEDSKEWELKGDIKQHLEYNCDDCIYTLKIYHSQRAMIKTMGLETQLEMKMAEWPLAVEMMQRGVLVDREEKRQSHSRVMLAAMEREERLLKIIPPSCRPPVQKGAKPFERSNKQILRCLYEILHLKSAKHRKTGNDSIDDEALRELQIRYPYFKNLFDLLIELRSLRVFANNFLSAETDVDGRWRTAYNIAGPETHRWSSSENAFGKGTNFQNIPSGTED